MIYTAQLSWLWTSLIVSEIVSVFEKKPSFLWITHATKGRTMTSTHAKFHLEIDERTSLNPVPYYPYPSLHVPSLQVVLIWNPKTPWTHYNHIQNVACMYLPGRHHRGQQIFVVIHKTWPDNCSETLPSSCLSWFHSWISPSTSRSSLQAIQTSNRNQISPLALFFLVLFIFFSVVCHWSVLEKPATSDNLKGPPLVEVWVSLQSGLIPSHFQTAMVLRFWFLKENRFSVEK